MNGQTIALTQSTIRDLSFFVNENRLVPEFFVEDLHPPTTLSDTDTKYVPHRKWAEMLWTIDDADIPAPHAGDAWTCDVRIVNHNLCVVMPKEYQGYFPTESMIRRKDDERYHARRIYAITRTIADHERALAHNGR